MESTTIFRSNAVEIIADKIRRGMGEAKDCVFLCIGTSGIVSDSLGPVVGSIISEKQTTPMTVYGTKETNVNAQNLPLAMDFIKAIHPDKKIVVIDAAVGDSTEVGCVQVKEGSICPGAATDKKLPEVGDLSVLGVVSMRGAQHFYSTHEDRVSLVQKMAETIAQAIVSAA